MEEFFKIADDPILSLWMNKARTIELNPRKIRNDPNLLNPAKTVRKNLLEFADDPILPLKMNQAKTFWKNPMKFVYDPILTLWMNKARTIQMNKRKIQK